MGLLRLILAVSVIFSHAPAVLPGWWPLIGGELAVQIFFMISGFYMSLVLSEKYREADGRVALQRFWLARAVRIYPAYWIVMALTLAYLIAVRAEIFSFAQQLGPVYAAWAAVSNVVLFGLDGLLFAKVADGATTLVDALGRAPVPQPYHLMVVSPAWTLSLELMFYLLAPVFAGWRTRSIVFLALGSFALRFVAYQAGFDGDPWRYRFFPFELSMFLAGMLAHRAYAAGRLNTPVFAIALVALLIWYPWIVPVKLLGFSVWGSALLIIAALALPWVFQWRKDSVRDRQVGEMSYSLYLVHLPILKVLSPYLASFPSPMAFTGTALALSFACAMALDRFVVAIVNPALMGALDRWRGQPAQARA